MSAAIALKHPAPQGSVLRPPGLSAVAAPAALSLQGVWKTYGAKTVLQDLNLDIAQGEFVAIVGFSGSGKTTLVNLLAGLAQADRGAVLKQGQPIKAPGPDRGIVFQSYSLMPWLSVRDNVALAVDRVSAGTSAAERADQCQGLIEWRQANPHNTIRIMREIRRGDHLSSSDWGALPPRY